jgi:cytidyltransferase-like protein
MQFNYKAPTGLMLGRFQPWHKGHRTLFERILEKEGQVCICIRDTQGTSAKDPLSPHDVADRIHADLSTEFDGKYTVTILPNVTGVYYGRDVGYKVEQIKLDDAIEAISATNIRKELAI